MMKRSKAIDKEIIVLSVIMLLSFPLVLFGTGTLTSGWHLVDDHETVELVERKISENISLIDSFKEAYANDITHRWRPAYWFFRVLGAYVFGDNSVVHNLFLCFIGMACYWLLYQTARNLKCRVLFAHFFAASSIFGRQYEMWYRVANQENIGLFFLAICLWIISFQYKNVDFHNKVLDGLLLVCSIICSLIKESFFLVFPAIILLRLGLEGINSKGGMKKWVQLLIRKTLFWVPALAAFLWSAYMIAFYVGTAPIDYAGVDVDEGWQQVWWNIQRMPKESLEDFVGITIACSAIMMVGFVFLENRLESISLCHALWTLFGIYIVIGQIILYAKSGMWNRYLVPFTIGYGLIFLVLAEKILKNKYMYVIYAVIFFIFLATRVRFTIVNRAIPYATEGRMTQQMLGMVIDNTTEESNILISLGMREEDGATGMYLEYAGRRNVFFYMESDDGEQWKDEYYCSAEDVKLMRWDAVVTSIDRAELESVKLPEEEWKKEQLGDCFSVYLRMR